MKDSKSFEFDDCMSTKQFYKVKCFKDPFQKIWLHCVPVARENSCYCPLCGEISWRRVAPHYRHFRGETQMNGLGHFRLGPHHKKH